MTDKVVRPAQYFDIVSVSANLKSLRYGKMFLCSFQVRVRVSQREREYV